MFANLILRVQRNLQTLKGYKMNISKKLLAVAILAAVSSTAFAAEKGNELSVYGNIQDQISPSTGSGTTTTINASYGKYMTDRLLITGSAFIMDNTGFKMITAGVGTKYYFKVGQKGDFVPFVAGSVQLGSINISGVGSGNTFGLDLGGGASYFVTETASLDGHIDGVFGSESIGGNSTSTTNLNFTVGITQRF
jgi:hypothetical protein